MSARRCGASPVASQSDNRRRTSSFSASSSRLTITSDQNGVSASACRIDTTTYAYDGAGNQETVEAANGDLTTHTWDDENRRLTTALPSGYVHTATYNAEGQRVELLAPGSSSAHSRNYVWDGSTLLTERWAPLMGQAQFIYTVKPEGGFGKLVGTWVPGFGTGIDFDYFYDAGGNAAMFMLDVHEQYDASPGDRTPLAPFRYDAFGTPITSLASGVVGIPDQYFGAEHGYFTDRYYTGSGGGITANLVDYYVRARTYEPSLGRWLSADPIGFFGGDFNLYRYVSNNPVLLIDPSGLLTEGDCRIWKGATYEIVGKSFEVEGPGWNRKMDEGDMSNVNNVVLKYLKKLADELAPNFLDKVAVYTRVGAGTGNMSALFVDGFKITVKVEVNYEYNCCSEELWGTDIKWNWSAPNESFEIEHELAVSNTKGAGDMLTPKGKSEIKAAGVAAKKTALTALKTLGTDLRIKDKIEAHAEATGAGGGCCKRVTEWMDTADPKEINPVVPIKNGGPQIQK